MNFLKYMYIYGEISLYMPIEIRTFSLVSIQCTTDGETSVNYAGFNDNSNEQHDNSHVD